MGRGVPHPRGYGNSGARAGRYVREKHVISLEEAVRKMTSLPAAHFGFADARRDRRGHAADLVVFDAATRRPTAPPTTSRISIRTASATCSSTASSVVTKGAHTQARPGQIVTSAR